MAERFAKVNEQEMRELLDNTTPKILCLSICDLLWENVP